MMIRGYLGESLEMLEVVADYHNLKLNRVRQYKMAVIILSHIEIKLNRELNQIFNK